MTTTLVILDCILVTNAVVACALWRLAVLLSPLATALKAIPPDYLRWLAQDGVLALDQRVRGDGDAIAHPGL